MRVMLVHLSDLHITGSRDVVLSRFSQIADGVRNLDYSLDLCTIVVTGDLAYSGKEEQYVVAWDFLIKLRDELVLKLTSRDSNCAVPVHFVGVPGNHDCDFEKSGTARDMILDGVLKDPNKALDNSVVQICIQAQDSFFEFLGNHASGNRVESANIGTPYDSRLYYEYRFGSGDQTIRFMCCNTPWLSRLRDIQGQLFYPTDAVPCGTSDHALSIAIFHHPYPWLETTNRRSFQKRIEEVADLVLTGHEHDATRRTQQSEKGGRNTYIEGGALHDAEDQASSIFNAFVIDTDLKKQKFVRLLWDGEKYSPSVAFPQGKDGAGLAWEEFQINRLRQSVRFSLSPKIEEYLDDPDVYLTHRHRGNLKLSDVFVFPDLREAHLGKDTQQSVIRGEHLLDLVSRKPHLIITGDSQCGKTSLAKMLYRRLHEYGDVPVILPCDRRPPTDDSLFGYIEELFAEQYDPASLTSYRQMDRNRRVVIIDDYHKLPLSASTKKKFIANLAKFSGRIILLASDILLVEDLTSRDERTATVPSFALYRIQAFGHLLRNQLVERWLLLNTETDADGVNFAHNLTTITRQLNTLIGKNFVPPFPVYILSVLQASEAATPIDTTASTHGYFYELFIKLALASGKTQIEYDVVTAYLRHLSYYLFANSLKEIDETTFRQIHALYEQRYDITRSFEGLRDALTERHMIVRVGSRYRFKHPYQYYFFVAAYMRDHLNEVEIRDHLRKLSRALFIQQNANILLFLAHLSKNPAIVDEMLSAAQEHYNNFAPALLTEDAKFLDQFEKVADDFVYEERDPKKVREEMLEALDRENPPAPEETETPELIDPASPLAQINAAFKTLQILGQILKNFPGSMEGPTKLDIARACVSLGRRINSFFFQLIRENERTIVQDIAAIVRVRFPNFKDDELERRARETVVGMAKLLSYGLVKRVSHAIGSPYLNTTYEKLVKENPDSSTRLIELSTRLDHSGTVPDEQIKELAHEFKSSHLPLWILRGLVVEHFYLFPVEYRVKQRVCESLGIAYSQLQTADPSRKLLPSSKSE
ncbi:MAG: hypothetical protein HOP00_12220 [Nitrospira sp.]|nr:hypothetical protein [Nitrospira sp.]